MCHLQQDSHGSGLSLDLHQNSELSQIGVRKNRVGNSFEFAADYVEYMEMLFLILHCSVDF